MTSQTIQGVAQGAASRHQVLDCDLLLCNFSIVRLVTVSMAENNLNTFSGSSSPGTSSGSCISVTGR